MNNAEPWCPAALTTGGWGGSVWVESKYRRERKEERRRRRRAGRMVLRESDQVKKQKQWKCRAEKGDLEGGSNKGILYLGQ